VAFFLAENNQERIKDTLKIITTALQHNSNSKKAMQNEVEASARSLAIVALAIKQEFTAELQVLKIRHMTLSREIENYEKALSTAKANFDISTGKLEELQKSILLLASQKLDLEIDQKVLEMSSYVLSKSGFFGYIFDGILDDLNKEININLKMIPNVRQYSLQFTPDKVAKTTGVVSKSITFEIKNGNREVAFKPLSGGEKLGLIIAVDEALDTVLSNRLGVHVGWKILDEQFTWIDSNSKEAILEFFKSKSYNKSYFIVDHTSEFNAAVDSRIIVRKRNGIAQVEQ
jgi:DNA repair exonuclease SbcCD ATPase subunit